MENQAFRLPQEIRCAFLPVCIPILVVLSLLIAVLFDKKKKRDAASEKAVPSSYGNSVASVVILWKVLFHDQGLLNHLLSFISVRGIDWMNTDASFGVLVFSYIWRNLGYDIVLWAAGLGAIPGALYDAARVDGAGEWKCFFCITLPNLLPTMFTIVVLSLLNGFKVFREAYLVAGDYPQNSMYLLAASF